MRGPASATFAVFIALVASGCVELEELVAPVDERPVAAPAPLGDVAAVDERGSNRTVFRVTTDPEPIPMEFVGEGMTSDEWGREVRGLHFRTRETAVFEDGKRSVTIDTWVDAANGRFLHQAQQGETGRAYFSGGDQGIFSDKEGTVLFSFLLVGQLLERPDLAVYGYHYTMAKTDEQADPDCVTYAITWTPQVLDHLHLSVCVPRGHSVPTKAVLQGDGGDPIIAERTPDAFSPPRVSGQALDPAPLPKTPWESVTMGPATLQIPPDSYPDGSPFGSHYKEEVRGMLLSPRMLAWATEHPGAFPALLWEDYCGLCGLSPTVPDNTAWGIYESTDSQAWQNVQEIAPSRWAPSDTGAEFPASSMGPEASPDGLVPLGGAIDHYGDRLPKDLSFRVYHAWRLEETPPGSWTNSWTMFPICETQARFAYVSAVNGQLLADGGVALTPGGCYASGLDSLVAIGAVPRAARDILERPALPSTN